MKRVFVITGATSGIGRAAALSLAQSDAALVLVGRNPRRASEVLERIATNTPGARAQFIEANLSVQQDVRRLATTIRKEFDRVDVLINNAGARFDTYETTEDGLERTFATNHLGHFLLTCLLMRSLLQSGAGRVITVSSSAHRSARTLGAWQMCKNRYDRKQAYAMSKLANILFALELARRVRNAGVVSNAVDPGVVATNFARNNGLVAWAKHIASHLLKGELIAATSGADTIVYLATALDLADVSGKLFRRRKETQPSKDAENPLLAADLWAESIKLTELNETDPFDLAEIPDQQCRPA